MYYVNSREHVLVTSSVSVLCCDYLPALTDCGRFVTGNFKPRLECSDHLPPAKLVIEVALRNGILVPVLSTSGSGATDTEWVCYIRAARDRHEQNVELVPDLSCGRETAGCLRLRTSRDVRTGDELFVWYADQLVLDLGVPVLSPAHIRGDAEYACADCPASFRSPNALKTHIMYHCTMLTATHCRQPQTISGSASLLDLAYPGWFSAIRPMLLPPVTSSPPLPTNYFRLPTAIDVTARMLWEAAGQGQSQGRRKVQGRCWRPVCLDDLEPAEKEVQEVTAEPTQNRKKLTSGSALRHRPTAKSEHSPIRLNPSSLHQKQRQTPEVDQTGSRVVLTSSADGRHECAFCGKRYSRRYGLTIHVRTHTGHKPLQCAVCRRPFGDPSNLNKHVRLHAGDADTPYRCRHCGKVLVRRRDLERHIRSRHPDVSPDTAAAVSDICIV